jgi:hypothetical protein
MSELIEIQYLLLEKKFVCFNGNVLLTTNYFSIPEDSKQIIKIICVLCKVAEFYDFFFIVTVNLAYNGAKHLRLDECITASCVEHLICHTNAELGPLLYQKNADREF